MQKWCFLPKKKKNYVNHCLPQTVIGNKIPHGKVNDYWGKNGAKNIHSVTSDNLGLLCATKFGHGCKDLLRDKSQFSHSPTPSTSLGTGGERDTGSVCHCLGDSDAGIHCLLSWFIGTPALASMHRDLWVRQLERTSNLQFPTERRVLSLKRKIFTFPICFMSPNKVWQSEQSKMPPIGNFSKAPKFLAWFRNYYKNGT